MSQQTLIIDHLFYGDETPPLVGSPDSAPFRRRITGAAPPTVRGGTASGRGALDFTLTATNEAQVAAIFTNDKLGIDIDDLIWAEWDIYADAAAWNAAVSLHLGFASAGNDAYASIAQFVGFKFAGAANLPVIMAKDGVTTQADVVTGLPALGNAWRRFRLDFGIGGKADVRFSGSKLQQGTMNTLPVKTNSPITMAGYSAGLQPYVQLQKSASTATAVLSLRRMRYALKFPL